MTRAAKRARGAALEATVSIESIPGLGCLSGMFARADGTRLFTTFTPPSGKLATIAENSEDAEGFKLGSRTGAGLRVLSAVTVDHCSNIVLADY